MRFTVLVPLYLLCCAAFGADLCAVAQNTASWKNREVSFQVRLTSGYHGGHFIPANAAPRYTGRCIVYPILPGELDFLAKGVAPVSGPQAEQIRKSLQSNLDSKHVGESCFATSGVVKVIDNYRYDNSSGRGNGFGYHGVYPVALVVDSLVSSRCDLKDGPAKR